MDKYTLKDFGKLLKKHSLEVRRLLDGSDTDVMRVYDRFLSEIEVTVDLYGPYARITNYSNNEFNKEDLEAIVDVVQRMLYIEEGKVVYHNRLKRESIEQHTLQSDDSLIVSIKESGLTFKVDLTKRVDTGLFLDQLLTRRALKDVSANLDVLNLFSYTGSFSVYAASGGAKSVTSVDLSATYTKWCEDNLKANNFFGDNYKCINQDAFEFLKEANAKKLKYDFVVFDPPAFSNSRKTTTTFDIQKDYTTYLNLIHPLLNEGGQTLFISNLKNFKFNKSELSNYEAKEITKEVLPPGFSKKKSGVRSWILTKI
ncbi:MAG: class I SAM-dependent methyltransferase [Sphaerochaetaceae bacterium]|jgi:23S rRNA G2069 N7-methylase RlmK/C1962 C5-methylase RlmI